MSREYVSVDCVRVVGVRDPRTRAFVKAKRVVFGQRLQRKFPKVKGKANVKRAKKARRLARESALKAA